MVNVQRIEEGPGISTKEVRLERGRFLVGFDERLSDLNHEKNAFLRR